MKPIVDLLAWLLERDIRVRNATSALVALTGVVGTYFLSRNSEWFRDLDNRPSGLPAAFVVVFLIAFLSSSLIGRVIGAYWDRRKKHQKEIQLAKQRESDIRRTLANLTQWQRQFVLRYIVEQTTQIPDFEVGGYRAAWNHELEMLVQKRVIHKHRGARVYEIDGRYYDYLLRHWNAEKGMLE